MTKTAPVKRTPYLRKLEYSPNVNPLLKPHEVDVKRKRRVTSYAQNVMDTGTGEVHPSAAIMVSEDVDEAQFVKIFAPTIAAAYSLTKTAMRVFQEILVQYQKMKMSGGYVEDVRLFWFDGGLDGRALGMSEKTFQRGLKALLENQFIYPRQPGIYWVNPALFFRGDRVRFIKEYRIKGGSPDRDPQTVDFIEGKTDNEKGARKLFKAIS